MKISCAMIAWNEESTIDLALKSIAGFVDEVVITDTGSFDGTISKANECIEDLNISGEVISVSVTNMAQARHAAWRLCRNDTILLIDSNLVLPELLKREIGSFVNRHTRRKWGMGKVGLQRIGRVNTLNLIGDYEHCFGNPRCVTGYHSILFDRDNVSWGGRFSRVPLDRPHDRMFTERLVGMSVNLSRVRPAWRCWYRGEPFDTVQYRDVEGGFKHSMNRSYNWMASGKYYSMVDYIEDTENLSLEDVKRIAPGWYLQNLSRHAKPLPVEFRQGLPEVIKEELKDPRYILIYEDDEIIDRRPEL